MLILKMVLISFVVLNHNNHELSVFIALKMTDIASGNQEFVTVS